MADGRHSRGGFASKKNTAILVAVLVVAALCINGFISFTIINGLQQTGNQDPEARAWDFLKENQSSKSSSANSAALAKMDSAQLAVQELVAPYGNDVAIAVMSLDGKQSFSINGNNRFVAASEIKLLILAEFMSEVDTGVRDLNSTYKSSSEDIVGGTGTIQDDPLGTVYTYDDLARYMIMYSDNTATNVLINSMGTSKINAKAASLNLTSTDLQRRMMDTNSGLENHISANDAATLLRGIADHTIASETMCEKAESYLRDQTDNQGLAQGIPSGVAFGHKTGTLDSVRHDAGIVYANKPYIIVVLTNLNSTEANELMAQISKAVYSALA